MSKKYTTADISKALAVSDRTARRKLAEHVTISGGRYELSEALFNYIIGLEDTLGDTSAAAAAVADKVLNLDVEYERVEYYTQEEYDEVEKRLQEYFLLKEEIKGLNFNIDIHKETVEYLKNDVEYHKRSSESKDRQMELLLRNIRERNFIEAKDKNLD